MIQKLETNRRYKSEECKPGPAYCHWQFEKFNTVLSYLSYCITLRGNVIFRAMPHHMQFDM